MKAKRHLLFVLAGLMVLASLSIGYADEGNLKEKLRGYTYRVTITNITRGQIISAPIVFSHKRGFDLFKLGQPSSEGLAALAEDGVTGTLESELLASTSVFSVATAAGGIPPGQSVTVEINAGGPYRFISTAGMLVSSNDAFFAARKVPLPFGFGTSSHAAEAYDAGSETNSEICDFIPGPPCGNGGVRDTDGAEGYVHIHAGIHGIGDLAPEDFDWRNPVALVEVEAVR